MSPIEDGQRSGVKTRTRLGFTLKRMGRSRDGAAAIEFAILAIPYFMIIFAIIETFIAFSAEQLLSNAVNTMSRKLRTGQITFDPTRATYMTEPQFRAAFCGEISFMMKCDATEIATPKNLYIDVRTFNSFGTIPTTIPRASSAAFADLDTSSFKFAPGGAKSINMMRVFYRWKITADIVRPYITTIRPADGSMPTDFLIVGTTAFQSEDYP